MGLERISARLFMKVLNWEEKAQAFLKEMRRDLDDLGR